MAKHKPKIIVVVGPTASGKSDLGIKLAQKFNGEIISADSRQIYKGMDIGTAKVTQKERRLVKHYLVDILNPDKDYTVANFKKDAINAIQKILKKGRLPILVGGTGLYVQSVVENLDIPEAKPNPKLRKELERYLAKEGLPALFQKLVTLDPEAAYVVDGKNPRRVIRALEVAIVTGKPFSSQRKKNKPLFDFLELGISFPEKKLKQRINKRADQMVKQGLIKEVKKLIKKYAPKTKAFDAIGYLEIINFLNGKISLKEATELIKTNTWRFAKRQMTWFKKDKKIHWIQNQRDAIALVKNFLNS